MYTREFKNQKTEAVIKAAVLNRFIQIAAPKAVKVARALIEEGKAGFARGFMQQSHSMRSQLYRQDFLIDVIS